MLHQTAGYLLYYTGEWVANPSKEDRIHYHETMDTSFMCYSLYSLQDIGANI